MRMGAWGMSLFVVAASWCGRAVAVNEPIAECFGADAAAAKACRLEVAAAYHALQYAQAKQGLTRPSCAFDRGVHEDTIVTALRDDLVAVQAKRADAPPLMAIIVALSTSEKCTRSVATTYGGPSSGWLLQLCGRSGDEAATAACAAYLGATFGALQLSSGFGGAAQFVCPPEEGVQGRMLLELLKRAVAANRALRDKPVAEGVALSTGAAYPCAAPAPSG